MQLVPEETEDDLPDEQEALEEETLQPDDEPDVDYGKSWMNYFRNIRLLSLAAIKT